MTDTPGPTGFSFPKIIVNDLEGMARFYTDVFGLKEAFRYADGEGEDQFSEIILGSAANAMSVPSLGFMNYPNKGRPQAGALVTGFVVADVDATMRTALANGGALEKAAYDMPHLGIRVGFVRDPEGHSVEIVQQRAPA